MTTSVRMEELLPHQVQELWAVAPVAYVPIGCIEYHGPHLPLGVDGFTARVVCEMAARDSGGVVHPISFMANGCLDLPYTITYPPAVVEQWARTIIRELHRRGAQLVVLLTGHGPLDLIHLLKRVCREEDAPNRRAYGLCYLELNAAMLTAPERGEPTTIDHASTVETSWIMSCRPELVDLSLLPEDPEARTLGVYGKNPRFTASVEFGRAQQRQCADLLARRSSGMLSGDWSDDGSDLRTFVEYVWPEPLELRVQACDGPPTITIANPGRASRYITAVTRARVDDSDVDLSGATVVNQSEGEVGRPMALADLSPENGIYVRRGQTLDVVMPGIPSMRERQCLRLSIELGGVQVKEIDSNRTDGHE